MSLVFMMMFRRAPYRCFCGSGLVRALWWLSACGVIVFTAGVFLNIVPKTVWLQMRSSLENRFFSTLHNPEKPVLPAAEGSQTRRFTWSYQGKQYELDETLYASYDHFYQTLPTGVSLEEGSEQDQVWWAKLNTLFLTPVEGDDTVSRLAQELRVLGRQRGLSDDQIVEFVAAFVQAIPYDQAKTDRRQAGQSGIAEKTTYPYEVLYDQKGVCQDKSYLAYRLLQELGYGVAILLFPDPQDNHMAVGVQCPKTYSNYASSGYCFLETTSAGNKIGMIPEISPETRVATADVVLEDIKADPSESRYRPLGRVAIINRTDGKTYTGIISTLKTRDELERLRQKIDAYRRQLKALDATIKTEEAALEQEQAKLEKLKQAERYEVFNQKVEDYNARVARFKKRIADYNTLVDTSNALVKQHNTLSKSFYGS